jgi:predicted nuclease of restriction endonuclease-like RecB superfamily
MFWSIVYLQKKAKDFRKSEVQGNVKVESSYLANAEESLPKKKKHKSKLPRSKCVVTVMACDVNRD